MQVYLKTWKASGIVVMKIIETFVHARKKKQLMSEFLAMNSQNQ